MPKFIIRAPRYIDGKVVKASPEAPAIIELPEGTKVDKGLELVAPDVVPVFEKPKAHFAEKLEVQVPKAPEAAVEKPKGGKRASDQNAI